ncbi:MAG: aminotransferase class III-fold pyridoxal phosphate-dependent enzyme [Candidatus Margulisiibacteriota bacterium]
MQKEEIIARYKKVVSPVLGHYNDLVIKGAKGPYLFGADGKNYLDFSCGIAVTSLGHCHPMVVSAVKKQLSNLEHICIGVAYYEKYIELAEKLAAITKDGLDMCFFCQDGSGAIEAAIKLAKYTTKKQGIISFTGSFHGRTFAAMSVTNSKEKYKKGYEPLMANVFEAPYPYCYRCPGENGAKCDPDTCTKSCIKAVEDIISREGKDKIAAVLIEPVLGEGGYAPPPAFFLQQLKSICEQNGILLIFDEVQTGFGRTGRMFAHEHFGVVPDIMCMAKGIANGLPLGGIIAKKEVMEKWSVSAHGGTFGGNPVSCAAALATIDVMQKKGFLGKVERLGTYTMRKLDSIKSKCKIIGDVRGLGLMIGIELIKENGEPNPEATSAVVKECLNNGLLLISCGSNDQVIRFIPPLNVKKNDIDHALKIFEDAVCKM